MEIEAIRQGLEEYGYCIVKGLFQEEQVKAMSDFWIRYFPDHERNHAPRVTWQPHWSAPDSVGFTSDLFQCLWRVHEYPWNATARDLDTLLAAQKLNTLRNLILNRDAAYGTRLIDGHDLVYTSVSWYPPDEGYMGEHKDSDLHGLLPLTFLRKDFTRGGLRIQERGGRWKYIEPLLSPGDAVFYDGSLPHEVMTVYGGRGRLQMFPLIGVCGLAEDWRALARIPALHYARAKYKAAKETLKDILALPRSYR